MTCILVHGIFELVSTLADRVLTSSCLSSGWLAFRLGRLQRGKHGTTIRTPRNANLCPRLVRATCLADRVGSHRICAECVGVPAHGVSDPVCADYLLLHSAPHPTLAAGRHTGRSLGPALGDDSQRLGGWPLHTGHCAAAFRQPVASLAYLRSHSRVQPSTPFNGRPMWRR